MRRSVLGQYLWDARRALGAWSLGMAAAGALYTALYPALSDSLASVTQDYPEALKQAFNVQDFSTPAGYLGSSAFGVVLPLLLIVFAVLTGSRAIAGDEEAGFLELVFAAPLSRASLALQRLGALVLAAFGLGLVVLVVLLVIVRLADIDLAGGNLAAAVLQLVLLGCCFGALAFAVGAATGRRAWAAGAAAVVGVETYVAGAFVAQIDALSWLRYLSPFHYYDGGQPLANGLQVTDALVLAVVTLVLAAAGLPAFLRRDVGR